VVLTFTRFQGRAQRVITNNEAGKVPEEYTCLGGDFKTKVPVSLKSKAGGKSLGGQAYLLRGHT
jgi:hypothetical protein